MTVRQRPPTSGGERAVVTDFVTRLRKDSPFSVAALAGPAPGWLGRPVLAMPCCERRSCLTTGAVDPTGTTVAGAVGPAAGHRHAGLVCERAGRDYLARCLGYCTHPVHLPGLACPLARSARCGTSGREPALDRRARSAHHLADRLGLGRPRGRRPRPGLAWASGPVDHRTRKCHRTTTQRRSRSRCRPAVTGAVQPMRPVGGLPIRLRPGLSRRRSSACAAARPGAPAGHRTRRSRLRRRSRAPSAAAGGAGRAARRRPSVSRAQGRPGRSTIVCGPRMFPSGRR